MVIILLLALICIGIFYCAYILSKTPMTKTNEVIIFKDQPKKKSNVKEKVYNKFDRPIHGNVVNDFYPYPSIVTPNEFRGDIYPYNRFDGDGHRFVGEIGSTFVPSIPDGRFHKVGLLTQKVSSHDKKNVILNLYKRTISDYAEIYEYSIEDRDGFIIPLKSKVHGDFNRLENGDVIDGVLGYENNGPFNVNIFNDSIFHYTPFV